MLKSIEELRVQLAIAEDAVKEEESEMRKLELLVEKDVGIKTPGKPDMESMIIEPIMMGR